VTNLLSTFHNPTVCHSHFSTRSDLQEAEFSSHLTLILSFALFSLNLLWSILRRKLLKPGGVLLLVDVFLKEGESRQQYLERYAINAEKNWTSLSPAERALIQEHVETCDFPEEWSSYQRFAQNAGFAASECLVTDSQDFGKVVVLRTD
jgi:hypothetical protein